MADSYFDWYCQRRKESSIVTIRNVIYNHLVPEFGKIKIDHIVPKHIMNYQNKVINTYSAKHLKKIHAVLSAIFNFSIKFHGLTNNPAKLQVILKKNPINE